MTDVYDKNLNYFWDYMLHEGVGTPASPDEITNLDDLKTKIEPLLAYLHDNYSELKPDKIIYHYYHKRKSSFLGLEIVLDNPKEDILGTLRIYRRDGVFFYTFATCIEISENPFLIKKVKQEVKNNCKLTKFAHTTTQQPVFFITSETIDLSQFRVFYRKLILLSENMNLYIPS